jgi:hypothetical protein
MYMVMHQLRDCSVLGSAFLGATLNRLERPWDDAKLDRVGS